MLDEKLRKLETLLENLRFLPEILGQLTELRHALAPGEATVAATEYKDEFERLRDLVSTAQWPQAVDDDLICHDDNAEDKTLRAEGIIEYMIDEPLRGKKFLDFGCGEGHVVQVAAGKGPTLAYGFDPNPQNWGTLVLPPPHEVGTDWDQVVDQGPYDLVLAYDVLDHLDGDPVAALSRIKGVLADGGKIYLRCHPWVSRHATHLYRKINKAYLHLVFSEVELTRMGYVGQACRKIIHPHHTYKKWFNDAQLDLENENAIQESLEDFFHENELVRERIKANWLGKSLDPDLNSGKGFPSLQMRLMFIDYILRAPQ